MEESFDFTLPLFEDFNKYAFEHKGVCPINLSNYSKTLGEHFTLVDSEEIRRIGANSSVEHLLIHPRNKYGVAAKQPFTIDVTKVEGFYADVRFLRVSGDTILLPAITVMCEEKGWLFIPEFSAEGVRLDEIYPDTHLFPDADERSPNNPSVLMSESEIKEIVLSQDWILPKGVFNALKMEERLRNWVRSRAIAEGWQDAMWIGGQLLLTNSNLLESEK